MNYLIRKIIYYYNIIKLNRIVDNYDILFDLHNSKNLKAKIKKVILDFGG